MEDESNKRDVSRVVKMYKGKWDMNPEIFLGTLINGNKLYLESITKNNHLKMVYYNIKVY